MEGTVPAAAVEQPMREIASVIASMGLVPSETDLTQLDQAIDMKVAAVQPDFTPLFAYIDSRMAELAKTLESERYELCEFYFFRHPQVRPGFMPAEGSILEDVATRYPQAWDYLQSCEGRKLCVTEEEWQAMSRAAFATLADGTEIGWNGTGGVPFYAPDLSTGNLRLPDLRGMYAEAAGFDGLDVGSVHGDGIREIEASMRTIQLSNGTGAFSFEPADMASGPGVTSTRTYATLTMLTSRVVPTASKNQPRAWGALACVYLGRPAA